ncbi:LPS-assembly lipoprotein [Cricetibacter osteomyelitidis]|uniref:LPS-assembly lipoprotein LptE n=1 Tax=Cricetibacter osteomyelitidis TaxID=1521931 RepID=A0A4R2TBF5_9PAST|nr:LPS assembly lipoprotein LptE [Cricetibacter osteomyelitidis]TCP92102.1 LPS-assembly lipoprotein [Cricetibacter osteomyelitidis]
MLKKLILTTALFALTACGYHFQNEQLLPQELRTIQLESNDPYSDMSRAMRGQLQLRNVNIVENQKNVAVLRLNKTTFSDKVASVFKQGREAEKILTLRVDATVKLPNQTANPISVKINRTFFDNSRAALAKSAEREMIYKDMYEQAARQIIVKMAALKGN